MKIEKFSEAKDPIIGETIITNETDITFKVSKSRGTENLYSLRIKIPGIEHNYGWQLIGSNLSKERLEQEKMNFLSKISNFHRNAKKYNI